MKRKPQAGLNIVFISYHSVESPLENTNWGGVINSLFVLTFTFEFLTLCQGRAPIMWTCAIQNTSWHNHLPPQTIYHWRTSSFIVQKSSRCPRDKTDGLLLIHYLLLTKVISIKSCLGLFFLNNQIFFWNKTNGLLCVHYLLKKSRSNKVLGWAHLRTCI